MNMKIFLNPFCFVLVVKRMAIAHKVRKNKRDSFYKCAHHETHPDECPQSNIIQYDILKYIVRDHLMSVINKARKGDVLRKECEAFIKNKYSKSNSTEIKRTESRLKQLVKIASKLYEDYANDLINDRTYKELLLKNKQEQDILEAKHKELLNQEEHLKLKLTDVDKFVEVVNKYLDNLELTIQMVNSLIEKIIISPTEIVDGEKQRNIRIVYKFINESID